MSNNQQQSEIPDLSNPYAYPSNPNSHPTTEDHALTKLKSTFWKNTGLIQSRIGALTGSSSLEEMGQQTQEEAERTYQKAEYGRSSGVPSRLHGEYDRFMGYLNYAIGHVAGDEEMQERANQRAKKGSEEIDKSLIFVE